MSDPGFVVGGRYANTAGEYEVVELADGYVVIRYANGFQMRLPAHGLWAQWEALVAERTGRPIATEPPPRTGSSARAAASPRGGATRAETAPRSRASGASAPAIPKAKKAASGDAGFYAGVGFLAMGCEITAAVAGRDYPAFAQRYKIHTGRNLVTPHVGLEIHERPTQKMGAELTLTFPASPNALSHFDLGAKAESAGEAGMYVIGGTSGVVRELVERLLKLGFDLGPNTDPWPVRERVPEAHRADFDRGLALRRALHR